MKTYIDVPLAASHRARALGARWDMSRKSWFVPDGVDLRLFKEWMPEALRPWLTEPAKRRTR